MNVDLEAQQFPDNAFAAKLKEAGTALLASRTDPWKAVELFEPIIEQVRNERSTRGSTLPMLRALGTELTTQLGDVPQTVAMEVRHYCHYLRELDGLTSLTDMVMVTLTRFAHFRHHVPEHCGICAEYPGDIAFQGAPGGSEHFHEWIRRRGG